MSDMSTPGSTRLPSVRPFDEPNELVDMDGLISRIVVVGGLTVAHNIHQPGWRWSRHVKPVVGTEWCEAHHVGVALSGVLRVEAVNGEQVDIPGGTVFDIPPLHDGWVVGDEPWVSIDWTGVRSFIPTLDIGGERVVTTMLFTDIVDSTRTAKRLGEVAWADLVATHEERVRDTLGMYRGREIKTTGDGVLATFGSSMRAVQAALALVDVARALGLEIRAGLHTGEVELVGSDLRGVAVHETARIMSAAGPSQVVISATTHSLLDDPGLHLVDLGEHELKGLPGRRRLYRVEVRPVASST